MKTNKTSMISGWLDLINGSLKKGETVELPVLSGSMMPHLIPGKNIRIKYPPNQKINIGDLVIFREGKNLTVHRALFKITLGGKRLIYQKGDMNRFGSWITNKQIIGQIESVQNLSDSYISLTSASARKNARIAAYHQILRLMWNILLITPRKMKQWSKVIKMNIG